MTQHFATTSAARYGDLASLRRLIEKFNEPIPARLLAHAAEQGHMDCVRYLLPLVPPNEIEEGLISAAVAGKTLAVEFLVAHCTHINTFNLSVFHACINNHEDVFSIVYPLCDVENVRNRLIMARYEPGHPQSRIFYDAQLREKLLRETAGDRSTRVLKM